MNHPNLRGRQIPTCLFLFYINAILTANLLVSIQPVSGLQWDISLQIDRKAEDAVGGEAFGQQPLVSIYNRKGTVKQYGLVGRVIATLHYQNTGFIEKDPDNYRWPEIEKLGMMVRGECVAPQTPEEIIVDVINGEADFALVGASIDELDGDGDGDDDGNGDGGICINRSNVSYSIHFELQDEFNITLGATVQSDLSVEIGDAYQIGVIRAPILVEGGVTWHINPKVGVQDRGGNVVATDHNTTAGNNDGDNGNNIGTVSVALASNDFDEALSFEVEYEVQFEQLFQVSSPSELPWVNGTAEFHGLSIRTAGSGYQLNFTTEIDLPGNSDSGGDSTNIHSCLSDPIRVAVGHPETLVIMDEPALHLDMNTYGGKAFIHQPLLHVTDAGGNIITHDSTSKVTIELYSNPTRGNLLPVKRRVANIQKGIAQFSNLFIEKVGGHYRFKYALWRFNETSSEYGTEPNIISYGEFFDVKTGMPQALKLLRKPSNMWAGNQPFQIQPKVALVDAGGNTISSISDHAIETTVVESLSQTSRIVVDTRNDPIPIVESLYFHDSILCDNRTMYSSGHNITIVVLFTQEVIVNLPNNDTADAGGESIPFLTLNVTDMDGSYARALLKSDYDLNRPSRELIFNYYVQVNKDSDVLDIYDEESLQSNGFIISDAWHRNVSLVLPDPSSKKTLSTSKLLTLHNSAATIVLVEPLVEGGEYDTGHEIDFEVTFGHEVSVTGVPRLPLDLTSHIIIIDGTELGTSLSKSYFYIRYKSERSRSIPWDAPASLVEKIVEEMQNVHGPTCVSRSKLPHASESTGFRWAVRFDGPSDDIRVGFTVEPASVRLDHNATNIKAAYHQRSSPLSDWVADDGEETMCTYRFASYRSGTGTAYLQFRYEVLPGDDTSELKLKAPASVNIDSESDSISNALNDGSNSDIYANLLWNDAPMNFDRIITIDTNPAYVTNVVLSGSIDLLSQTFRAGDSLFIRVVFNKHFAMQESLRMSLYVRKNAAIATYYSSVSPSEVILRYVVEEGQWSQDLKLENYPNALFIEGTITTANLTLPWHLVDSPQISVDARKPNVVGINLASEHLGTQFHRGDQISIEMHFSSPMVILDGPPVLVVSLGGYFTEAPYVSGNQTDLFIFNHTVIIGDRAPPLVAVRMMCVASGCWEGSSREGYILQDSSHPNLHANIQFATLAMRNGFFVRELDGPLNINTSDSQLTSVLSILALHDDASVSVGEVIRIRVDFSDIVYCEGSKPELRLNVASRALYESGSGMQSLIFILVTEASDETLSLDWEVETQSRSPLICDGLSSEPCSIVNANGLVVDTSFVDEIGNNLVESLSSQISISASEPSIVSIYSKSETFSYCRWPPCAHTAGDHFTLFVKFDSPVSVFGVPMVALSANDGTGGNAMAYYESSLSNDTDIAFDYLIEISHSTNALPLVHTSSKIITSDGASWIRRNSTYPSVLANLALPDPNETLIQNNQGHFITVDGIKIPTITNTSFNNATGTFSPGDRIVISVLFDDIVSVSGSPVMLLDVGNGLTGCANYFDGNYTSQLQFEYIILSSHCVIELDYFDRHSLEIAPTPQCGNSPSSIRRASKSPVIDVNRTIADPGTPGSLSTSQTIELDCRVPHITRIWSPQDRGKFYTDDTISIMMEFSRAIHVDGSPLLLLETGAVDRKAAFVSQPNDTTVQFEYRVQLGDFTTALDYWAKEGVGRSSHQSFSLEGGSIMHPATNSVIAADIFLNPSYGHLDGLSTKTLIEGESQYLGLKIGKRGDEYKVRFGTNFDGNNFETEASISIEESCEYEVSGDVTSANPGDKFGSAVSLSGELLAVGVPHKKVPSPEVQVLTVRSDITSIEPEVQLISTGLDVDKSILQVQTFKTAADENTTIGGSFSLTYSDNSTEYIYASSVEFYADVDNIYMKKKLMERFPILGKIDVTRNKNEDCKCHNAWIWIITIEDASKGISLFATEGDGLRGNGSNISNTTLLLSTRMLGGYFSLRNPFNNSTSRPISYKASAPEMKTSIEEDLGIGVYSVHAANLDKRDMPELGRRWTITFSYHDGLNGEDVNVPNLISNSSLLVGLDAVSWCHIGAEGKAPVTGSFALSLRGSNFSEQIPYNASETELKMALESLESINSVTITNRKEVSLGSGFSWTITLDSVNKLSQYGWINDPGASSSHGNLPPLDTDSQLVGWNTKIQVQHEYGAGLMDTQAQWMAQTKGEDGNRRGEVAIYKHAADEWIAEDFLRALDGDANDDFGFSVDVEDDWIAIGAPSKEIYGHVEIQRIVCHGNVLSGTFTAKFRGQESDVISFDSSLEDIEIAIKGVYGSTNNLHALPKFVLKKDSLWGNEGFCSSDGNSFFIEFSTPDGGGLSTFARATSDIEELEFDDSHLVGGFIEVLESRKGSRVLSGNTDRLLGHQAGAVYLFQREKLCEFCSYAWRQMEKITALNAMESPLDSAQFGWSVALSMELLLIGSPGDNSDSGKVYSFRKSDEKWIYKKSLTSGLWNVDAPNNRFGHAVVINKDTVLISAPGYSMNKGAVFVFRTQKENNLGLLASQMIDSPYNLTQSAQFGHAIALFDDQALICAPQSDARMGSCYIYQRKGINSPFALKQQLIASNIRKDDKFGWSAAMTSDKIIIGQLQDYNGQLGAAGPVQVITISCGADDSECSENIDSSFRLSWRNKSMVTRLLSHSISAKQLKHVLEEDLDTGEINVSRSVLADKNSGHQWTITFPSFDYMPSASNSVPTLSCDSKSLTGTMPLCVVEVKNSFPYHVRGKVHLFTDRRNHWIEQAFLFPASPQRQDLFGNSVAIDGDFAAVGAPNRDLLNINSGAVMIHNLSFTNYFFNSSTFSVKEGDSLVLKAQRKDSSKESIIGFKSIDVTAIDEEQGFVRALWDLNAHPSQLGRTSPIQEVTGHSATSQESSEWIGGIFDYHGINDYQPIDEFQFIHSGATETAPIVLKTTDDKILEAPDETLAVQVSIPGMFASSLGDLTVDVIIEDDSDGYIGNNAYITKILGPSNKLEDHFGSAVGMLEEEGLMVVGNHCHVKVEGTTQSGAAFLFKRNDHNTWDRKFEILSPGVPKNDSHFGASVSISRPYGRDDVTILVGEPGQAAAHTFLYNTKNGTLSYEAILKPFNETRVTMEHRFADRGSININGDMAFIGASELEAVFCYRRLRDSESNALKWQQWNKLRSSDYKSDEYGAHGNRILPIRGQRFGVSVRSSHRLLLVSAPFAGYGSSADAPDEMVYNRKGIFSTGLGKGKIYEFFSKPHILNITLVTDQKITSGTFKLIHDVENSAHPTYVSFMDTPESLRNKLEEILAIGEVKITRETLYENHLHTISWAVAFLSLVADEVPVFETSWYGNNCQDCDVFSSGNNNIDVSIDIKLASSLEAFSQTTTFQGGDLTSADGFGISVEVEEDFAIVGAPLSSAKTRTTWDFETGNMVGWFATGDAFDYQPTYGDNSRRRTVYKGSGRPQSHTSGAPQSALKVGKYSIGTYEKRPGNKTDYMIPDERYLEGDSQGDGPVGTLTSDPFMIIGNKISFLIGGGCDHLTEYVELLVDSFATMRATGECSELMRRVEWDVSIHIKRSAQIRIVDASKELWGHINVDDFQFSWDMENGGTLSQAASGETGKNHYTGKEETPESGVAYVFKRTCKDWMSEQTGIDCIWTEEQRLTPSDKRAGNLFGASVAINKSRKLVSCLVGSSNAPAYGLFKEPPSNFPFNEHLLSFPVDDNMEFSMRSGGTLSPISGSLRLIDYLMSDKTHLPTFLPQIYGDRAGAAYLFLRSMNNTSEETAYQHKYWQVAELARFSPPDIGHNMLFGSSLALSQSTGLIGSEKYGAVSLFDLRWQSVKFKELEYSVLEGNDEVVISVIRDAIFLEVPLHIGYSTSDLSAVGIDSRILEICRSKPIEDREGCGDYEQTAGILEFVAGSDTANFTIQIIDDNCWERHIKYIQLNLYIPGGSIIQGENYRAHVRIDDNDWA